MAANTTRLLVINDQFRILVCTTCQFAVMPTQIEQHLRQHYKRIAREERRQLIAQIQQSTIIAQIKSEVVYPGCNSAPINGLPVFFDGFRCLATSAQDENCSYVCRSLYGIKEHCKKEHGWINAQSRGGDTRLKHAQSRGVHGMDRERERVRGRVSDRGGKGMRAGDRGDIW